MEVVYGCNFTSGELDTQRYGRPLPAIGLYVAASSLVCCLLLTVDVYRGFNPERRFPFRQRFTCEWFTINAFTITLLSVATKLPVDLNSSMPGAPHQLTKLSGTIMLSLSMAFFLPSFAEMEAKDMVSNVAALMVLVLTVVANICIQMGTGVIYAFGIEHILVAFSTLFMLMIVVNNAVCGDAIKDEIQRKLDCMGKCYEDKYTANVNGDTEIQSVQDAENTLVLWKESIPKGVFIHLVRQCIDVNHTITRSANGRTIGFFSLFIVAVFVEAEIRALVSSQLMAGYTGRAKVGAALIITFCSGECDYGWSIWVILISQNLFLLVAIIPLMFRFFQGIHDAMEPIIPTVVDRAGNHVIIGCWHLLRKEVSRFRTSYEHLSKELILTSPLRKMLGVAEVRSILKATRTLFFYLQAFTSLIARVVSRICCSHVYLYNRFVRFARRHPDHEEEDGYGIPSVVPPEALGDLLIYRRLLRATCKEMSRLSASTGISGDTDATTRLRHLGFFPEEQFALWETVLPLVKERGCCLTLSALSFLLHRFFELEARVEPIMEEFGQTLCVLHPILRHVDERRWKTDYSKSDSYRSLDGLPLDEKNVEIILPQRTPEQYYLLDDNIPTINRERDNFVHAVVFWCCQLFGTVTFDPSSTPSPETTTKKAFAMVSYILAIMLPKTIKESLPSFVKTQELQYDEAVYEANTRFFYYLHHFKQPLSPILLHGAPLFLHPRRVPTDVIYLPPGPIAYSLKFYEHNYIVQIVGLLYVACRLTAFSVDPKKEAESMQRHVVHVKRYYQIVSLLAHELERNKNRDGGGQKEKKAAIDTRVAERLWRMLICVMDGGTRGGGGSDPPPPPPPPRAAHDRLNAETVRKALMSFPREEEQGWEDLQVVRNVVSDIWTIITVDNNHKLDTYGDVEQTISTLVQKTWTTIANTFKPWIKKITKESARAVGKMEIRN